MKKTLLLCLAVAVFLCMFVGCVGNGMKKTKSPASDNQGSASSFGVFDARFIICDLKGNAVITENHIEQANVGDGTVNGQFYVHIQLDRTGTELLSYITSQSIGEKLPLYLDNELIYEPTVNDRVDDGEFIIMVDSEQEAIELYNKIASAMHGEEK